MEKFIDEEFSNDQIIIAIDQFLEYAEHQFGITQQGYFSGDGWAARCLRYQKQCLLDKEKESKAVDYNGDPDNAPEWDGM